MVPEREDGERTILIARRMPPLFAQIPQFMKASVFTQYGGPDVLHYTDMPDPVPQPDEVVVDVHAASVNGADHKVRRGDSGHPVQFPHILGRDFSGVVSAIGPQVRDLAVGDSVFGVLDRGKEGAYAEKLAITAAIIAR